MLAVLGPSNGRIINSNRQVGVKEISIIKMCPAVTVCTDRI